MAAAAAASSNGSESAEPGSRPANSAVGATTSEQVATRGDRHKGKGRGGNYAQTNGHDSSARSSSGPATNNDGEFPGLPSGDAARPVTAVDAPSSSHILVQQLKKSQQRKARQEDAILQLRAGIRRLQDEVEDATRQERRLQAEVISVQEQSKEQADKLQERQAELREQVKVESKLSSGSEREQQWSEELEAMRYQKDAACEQNADLQRSKGILTKGLTEQARRLKASEANIKNLEATRVEHRSQHKKLQVEAEELLQIKVESQAVGQELRKQFDTGDADMKSSRGQWQAASAVLTIVLAYLLLWL